MNDITFWEVIEKSKGEGSNCPNQAVNLEKILLTLKPEEIIEFFVVFEEKHVELFHWDFWGVAYLLNGGCSDDGFIDFRNWLIGRGKEAFEKAINDPESISLLVNKDNYEVCCEELGYASLRAYEKLTGNDIYDAVGDALRNQPQEPEGDEWDESNGVLKSRFPKTFSKSLEIFNKQTEVNIPKDSKDDSYFSRIRKWFRKK